MPGTISSAGSSMEQGAGDAEVRGLCSTDEKEAREASPCWVDLSATVPQLRVV